MIFIFSIVLGAEYLSNVKSIDTFAPTFFGYIISVLANVRINLPLGLLTINFANWTTAELYPFD